MTTFRSIRAAAGAGLLALTILSLAGGPVYAVPQRTPRQVCEEMGLPWDNSKGCPTQKCTHPRNEELEYKHGETMVVVGGARLRTKYKCDGFSGSWVKQIEASTGPAADEPTTATK